MLQPTAVSVPGVAYKPVLLLDTHVAQKPPRPPPPSPVRARAAPLGARLARPPPPPGRTCSPVPEPQPLPGWPIQAIVASPNCAFRAQPTVPRPYRALLLAAVGPSPCTPRPQPAQTPGAVSVYITLPFVKNPVRTYPWCLQRWGRLLFLGGHSAGGPRAGSSPWPGQRHTRLCGRHACEDTRRVRGAPPLPGPCGTQASFAGCSKTPLCRRPPGLGPSRAPVRVECVVLRVTELLES